MTTTHQIAKCQADFYKATGTKPTRVYVGLIQWVGLCREIFEAVPQCGPSAHAVFLGMNVFQVQEVSHMACGWSESDQT